MRLDHIPENWTIEKVEKELYRVFDSTGKQRCGAYKRTDGKPCMNSPIKGRERCKIHNGNAPHGRQHYNFKHGKNTRYALPVHLQEKARQLLERDDIDSLNENIVLLDVRLNELAERINLGEFGSSAVDLQSLYRQCLADLNAALRSSNDIERAKFMQGFRATFNEIGDMIDLAAQDYRIWREIVTVNDKRAALTKTKVEIETKGEGAVSAAEVIGLMEKLADLFMQANRLNSENERYEVWSQGIDYLLNNPTGRTN